jgi:hypothetical protein
LQHTRLRLLPLAECQRLYGGIKEVDAAAADDGDGGMSPHAREQAAAVASTDFSANSMLCDADAGGVLEALFLSGI